MTVVNKNNFLALNRPWDLPSPVDPLTFDRVLSSKIFNSQLFNFFEFQKRIAKFSFKKTFADFDRKKLNSIKI